MSINFTTNNPRELLASFKKAIDNKKVVTWSYDNQGDFTHDVDQWKNKAWLRPEIQSSQLVFNIIRPQNGKISSEVYGVYHGRIIESLLVHCDKLFTDGIASSLPRTGDLV